MSATAITVELVRRVSAFSVALATLTWGVLGVAPFLVPLYFAFGVVAALLGGIAARQRSRRASV